MKNMKPLFTLFLLAVYPLLFAQNSNKELDGKCTQSTPTRDRYALRLEQHYHTLNMANAMKRKDNNLNAFYAEYKTREDKAKKQMWWRIGIGAALLVLGIIGITRRRKKTP